MVQACASSGVQLACSPLNRLRITVTAWSP
jgi:hypothetical protein